MFDPATFLFISNIACLPRMTLTAIHAATPCYYWAVKRESGGMPCPPKATIG